MAPGKSVATSLVTMSMARPKDAAATSDRLSFFLSDGFLSSPLRPSLSLLKEARQLCRIEPLTVINRLQFRFLNTAASTRIHEIEMGPSVQENLLCHSRYIRDILAPVVAREGGRLNDQQMTALKTIFASLSTVRITVELLQYSRMEKALNVIAIEGSAWPVDATLLAEALLNSWEDSIGPLRNIRADLWGPGGRLEGIKKLKVPEKNAKSDEVSRYTVCSKRARAEVIHSEEGPRGPWKTLRIVSRHTNTVT